MAELVWGPVGERLFEAGIDRGVLYLHDGRVVPWNGLTGVEESDDREVKPFYMDGVKYLQAQTSGDFSAKLKAYTYPDEFDEVNGVKEVLPGLSYHNQPSKSFNLSYRTKIGNDVDGVNHAYKIHILYNVMVVPDSISFQTLGDSVDPSEFSWTLNATPAIFPGVRPTAHLSIDSRNVDPVQLAAIESVLYGSAEGDPVLPPPNEFAAFFNAYDSLTILDNGDGTWTAIDPSDRFITRTDPTTFDMVGVNAFYVDAVTYDLSNTE